MSPPRVLLADDHRMVAEGLKCLLEADFDLVGVVEDGRALIEATKALRPDVIVADISMPHVNGIEALDQIRAVDPGIKVVLLTMHQEPAYARRAFAAGASGFVIKHSAPEELVMAIQAAMKGRTFITPALAGELLQRPSETRIASDTGQALTPRQREILQFVAQGKSAKEIAAALSISPRTVEFHKHQLMEAHGLHSNAQLVHFAIKHGIVEI